MKPQGQRIIQNIGIGIGILGGGLGMIVGIAASPVFGSIFALVFIAIFGFVFGGMYLRGRTRDRLLSTGVQANGKIVEMWDTGVTINNQPQIGMKIEVYPASGMPFTAEVSQVISRLQTAYYQAGVSCVVRYDPANTKKIAIESIGGQVGDSSNTPDYGSNYQNQSPGITFGNPYFPGMNEQQIEKFIVDNDAEGNLLRQTGIECKATIKKNEFTNIYVQGQNTFNLFEVEVMPEGLHSYTAKFYGIVSAPSEYKFQVGNQIWVKYDRYNKEKVTFSHS